MNRYHLLGLSAAGGIMAGLAWTNWFTGLILLTAFVPFFILGNYLFENRDRFRSNAFFVYLMPGMLIFTSMSVGWVRTASIPAMITVIAGMSFMMTFTLWLGNTIILRAGTITGSIAVISFWMAFEFLNLRLPVLSPWINLGNGLAKDIVFIQWYEITGTGGGTLWVLLSNLLLSYSIVNYLTQNKKYKLWFSLWILLVIIPSIISIIRFYTINTNNDKVHEVLLVQPNIDPYNEKFTIPFSEQLSKTLALAEGSITSRTRWVVTPETTIDDPVNEELTEENGYIRTIRDFISEYPRSAVISGLVSYRLYPQSVKPPSGSARMIDSTGLWYDHFNSAFLIDSSGVTGIYHKSKLVTGIEMQLSSVMGRFINSIVPYMGGTKWGYGTQKERICFRHPAIEQSAAPVICYESAFGDYVADYVRKGANMICIITNDGWWRNTSGYRQHLSYASLRAVETRRMVARSANTGISCIIDIRGKIIKRTRWWEEAVLTGDISTEVSMTPYVKYGDYLYRISALLSVIILAYVIIALPLRKKNSPVSSELCNP